MPPFLTLKGVYLRNRQPLQNLHTGIIIFKIGNKSTDAHLFKLLTRRNEAVIIRGQRNIIPELFTAVYVCIKSAAVAVTTTLNTSPCQKTAYKWADFSRDRF